MPGPDAHALIRGEARAFEEALPSAQRKDLGQFFTGILLGRVLAHLVVESDTRRILDPMGGSGDLLDAAHEAAAASDVTPERLDAIEIDQATAAMCKTRLQRICNDTGTAPLVLCADAFEPAIYDALPETGYDLVITNPPYVRYQSLNGRADKVRLGLSSIANRRLSEPSRNVWRALVNGYSGLADLSVPSWLLAALLVRPGGRLALVVPATWRSRAYADVIRYLLLRCFRVELIVEDTQPGWFSDALVRTHLIVARRLHDDEIAEPVSARGPLPAAVWAQVAPEAASSMSLVGRAFAGEQPEADFAAWCYGGERPNVTGISARSFSLDDEWHALRAQAGGRPWMAALEQAGPDLPLFGRTQTTAVPVPEALRDLLPESFDGQALRTLDDAGICAGQGLRTGCNRFFYVRLVEEAGGSRAMIETDPVLGARTLLVPADALQPVLHRQADLETWRSGRLPATRVLDLRRLVLPEDMDAVRAAAKPLALNDDAVPALMPEELAAHVRKAGNTSIGKGANAHTVSNLSAVRTNIRPARRGTLPRFWYMLPDFMPRHLPQAFVPRIIHTAPYVYTNRDPAILIDANFSTFWTEGETWTAAGLAALLNSAWCRAVMEATGTPLGGGALKLEAVHLRKMAVPHLAPAAVESLNAAGQSTPDRRDERTIDRIVLRAVLTGNPSDSEIDAFAERLDARRAALGAARQRGAA